MPDVFNAVEISPTEAKKALEHLEKIKEAQADSGELSTLIGAAIREFNQFFLEYGQPYFTAHEFRANHTPESRIYNENMDTLARDIQRLYESVSQAAGSTLTSFNFATMVSTEVKNSAEVAASKVLDLNILSNFVKGTVIVAGDDFITSDKIDTTVAVETKKAQLVEGASAVGLKAVNTKIVSGPGVKINITPVMPGGVDGGVNTEPTPFNLERFYEGQYYARIGEQRPEGDHLNITYFADPSVIKAKTKVTEAGVGTSDDDIPEELSDLDTEQTPDEAQALAQGGLGFFAILPTDPIALEQVRQRMVDGDPTSFWECEYVFKSEQLIDPFDIDSEDVVIEGAVVSEDEEVSG